MGCNAASLISLSRCLLPFRRHLHVRADATSSLLATLSPWQKSKRRNGIGNFSYMESHRSGKGVGKMCLKKLQLFNFDIFIELWRGKKNSSTLYSNLIYYFCLFPFFLFAGVSEKTLKMYIFSSIYSVLTDIGIQ